MIIKRFDGPPPDFRGVCRHLESLAVNDKIEMYGLNQGLDEISYSPQRAEKSFKWFRERAR